ncbi:MAG: class I SAM-dependent RNA methyltransferase [Pseudorhodoplanes sp.]
MRLTITRFGHRGDGIAETPEGPVYVPYALPGETITAEHENDRSDRARLLNVEIASPERIAPICLHFGQCGGCLTQHWAADPYRAWKRGLVVAALSQAGIEAEVGALIDAHGEGRRRATFHARRGDQAAPLTGFATLREHRIVPISTCPILASGLDGALDAARAIAESLASTGKPLDIQTTATPAGMDVDIRGSGALSPTLTTKLATLAQKHRLARVTRHGELVVQRRAPMLPVGRASVPLPPAAFLQPTLAGEEALAALVESHVGSCKNIADLFAGIGPFALRLAEKARVTAIDSDDAAINALARAAATATGLKPIAAQARDLFRRPLIPEELKTFDAVVFDPPRQGADAQSRALAASKVPVIVAVSCDAATFARDARTLIDGGYRMGLVRPVDQFRFSAHVEIVARFERKR